MWPGRNGPTIPGPVLGSIRVGSEWHCYDVTCVCVRISNGSCFFGDFIRRAGKEISRMANGANFFRTR